MALVRPVVRPARAKLRVGPVQGGQSRVPSLRIQGRRPLAGSVRVGGRKNAALPLLAACLLTRGRSVLENAPDIRDLHVFRELVQHLGAVAEYHPREHRLTVDAGGLAPGTLPYELAGALRASYYLLSVQLALFGQAEVPLPGGDRIGQRPVDQHVKALTALGAEVTVERGVIRARADQLHGATIFFDVISVGATIQAMLAASLARGTTVLHNAAREPHVVDVAQFLHACGAHVSGAGTDVVRIRGGESLSGRTHTIIPDDIEAATLMIAAAATGGDVRVENVVTDHLDPVVAKLREAGALIEENGDWVRVRAPERLHGVNITTLPYPGFPTDAQSQMTALLTLASGESHINETLYEDRFRFAPELVRMGARIRVEGRAARIDGTDALSGCMVEATDIRAGAALVLAGLAAEGTTTVTRAEQVERGYENLAGQLAALGADISREE